MARPVKLGLDYFPMDIHVLKDIKIRRLMKKHKTPGVLLYFMLLCDIYESSFYVQIDKKLEQQYLLVPITVAKEEVTEKTSVNTDETCISAAETPIQTAESTQSKVKDNKEKESIFIIERESSAPARKIINM